MTNLFNSVKVTELPPVREEAANSAYHLKILLFDKICLAIFPFAVWDEHLGSDSTSS